MLKSFLKISLSCLTDCVPKFGCVTIVYAPSRRMSIGHAAAFYSTTNATLAQNQAKSALLFLYREALKIELPWLEEV